MQFIFFFQSYVTRKKYSLYWHYANLTFFKKIKGSPSNITPPQQAGGGVSVFHVLYLYMKQNN